MDNQKMNNNRPDQDPEGGNNKKDDMNKKSLLVMVVLAIAVMIIAQMLSGKIASASQKEVTYTEFMQDVKDGKVKKVELNSYRIYYEMKKQKNFKYLFRRENFMIFSMNVRISSGYFNSLYTKRAFRSTIRSPSFKPDRR